MNSDGKSAATLFFSLSFYQQANNEEKWRLWNCNVEGR
jgi:hypothetical protein